MEKFNVGSLVVWQHPAPGIPVARVLIVHGLGEHSGRYPFLVSHFFEHHIEVVRFDLRGCGESGGERMWISRFQDYVDDVASVRTWINTKLSPIPLFIFGHSLGGNIALRAVAANPESLNGLVLSAPAFKVGESVSKLKIFIAKLLLPFAPHHKIYDSLDSSALSRDNQATERYDHDPLVCHFNTLNQGNEVLKAMATLGESAAKVSLPVLLVHGSADRIVQSKGSQTLLSELKSHDKTLEIFAGGFHELHNDIDREIYFKCLTDWLVARAG